MFEFQVFRRIESARKFAALLQAMSDDLISYEQINVKSFSDNPKRFEVHYFRRVDFNGFAGDFPIA